MPMDAELLKILCCPETRQELSVADTALIADLNTQIASGSLQNRAGHSVKEPLDGGLLRADGKVLYPIRHGIPMMLIGEAIPLTSRQPE